VIGKYCSQAGAKKPGNSTGTKAGGKKKAAEQKEEQLERELSVSYLCNGLSFSLPFPCL